MDVRKRGTWSRRRWGVARDACKKGDAGVGEGGQHSKRRYITSGMRGPARGIAWRVRTHRRGHQKRRKTLLAVSCIHGCTRR